MLAERPADVGARTEALAAPLGPEDQVVQSMPDCSPTKWHRAHTTWFFDELVLGAATPADVAHWDPRAAWIEMRLVAKHHQHVVVPALDVELDLPTGSWLRTEISATFTADGVTDERWRAGLVVEAQWADDAGDLLLTLARPCC